MIIRKAVPMVVSALALGSVGSLGSAHAQGAQAPFTIRRPSDGAVLKFEKQRVEIPRAAVKQGDVVAFFIDDRFIVALAPPDPSDTKAARGPFTFFWNIKESGLEGGELPDGDHTIRAELYSPLAETAGQSLAMEKKASSEVKVKVANKIKNVTEPIYLRYKYREGENMIYTRDGKALVVSALSDLEATDDTQLASATGKLQLGIEDVRPDVSLVRNKLIQLKVNQGGQEMTLDPQQLSASMYQELDRQGYVHYETGASTGLTQFTALGLPVNNTLELPLLPSNRVAVGDSWTTTGQRLDIPGLPPSMQPRVTLENKFEDMEWEGGYPTAKIVQTYKGAVNTGAQNTIHYGSIDVSSPTVDYQRVIYLAYKSGTLVKTVRTLTISGRTTANLSAQTPTAPTAGPIAGGSSSPFGGGASGAPSGMQNYMNMMRGNYGNRGGGNSPFGGGAPGAPGGMQNYYNQMRGNRGRTGGGSPFGGGSSSPFGGRGIPGMSGGGSSSPFSGGGSSPFGSGAMMGNRGRGAGAVVPQETDHPVTLKAITVTELSH